MDLYIDRVDVWAATLPDIPGALAAMLATLHEAGAEPATVIARREPAHDGRSVVFVAPLQGDHEIRAATQIGFNPVHSMHTVRATGRDAPGVAAALAQAVADAHVNLHGFSCAAAGPHFTAYFSTGSAEEAGRVQRALEQLAMRKAA